MSLPADTSLPRAPNQVLVLPNEHIIPLFTWYTNTKDLDGDVASKRRVANDGTLRPS